MKNIKRNAKGFTLIEVMVVMAIVVILATIAYASYSNQVMRSNRADAKSALNDVGQRLQRCYTTYSAYNDGNCTVFNSLDGGGKIDSQENMYEVEASTLTATSYTLTATAVSPRQTEDTGCTVMTLTHTGRRTPTDCW